MESKEKPSENPEENIPADLRLPPQYEGLPAEIVEELWIIPMYVDPERTKYELERKRKVLEDLQQKESEQEIQGEDKMLKRADDASRILELEEKLGIPPKKEKSLVSLENIETIESMSIEEFAVWLVTEAKKRGKELGQTSAYDALTSRPEFRQLRITQAFGDSKPLMEIFHQNEAAIRQFTEETASKVAAVEGVEYVPDTWDHYKIRYEKRERKETHKGYVTIDKDQVLTEFTPDVRHEIVKRLRDSGYRGQVKFPVTGSRALFSYDNIVLHGNEPSDVDRGIEIVQDTLRELNLKYEAPRRGVDAEGIDGKKTSYTDRIAQLVEQAIKDPNVDIDAEIKKIKTPNTKNSPLQESTPNEQIFSEDFKKWFGDWRDDPEHASVVVDEEGKPLRVYHGGDGTIDTFNASQSNPIPGRVSGNYFSSSAEVAGSYSKVRGGSIIPVFINLRSPLITDPSAPFPYHDDALQIAHQRGSNTISPEDMRKAVEQHGHDGVIYEYTYRGKQLKEVVAFVSNQIKSAIGNSGSFSNEESSIMR